MPSEGGTYLRREGWHVWGVLERGQKKGMLLPRGKFDVFVKMAPNDAYVIAIRYDTIEKFNVGSKDERG